MSTSNEQDHLKQVAADWSAEQLRDGMIVGLGSGSTSAMAVDAIGKRVKEGLRIIGIPTSEQTAEQAERLGILVLTREDLAQALDRTLRLPAADQIYEEGFQVARAGQAKHEPQQALPLIGGDPIPPFG